MRFRSLPLGRVAGIPVTVSWTVVGAAALGSILLARNLLPAVDADISLTRRLLLAAGAITLFLGSILAHEFGHALTARRHGISTSSIKLWIFGGVAALSSPARSPKAEFQIAAAGPMVNGMLAVAFGGLTAIVSRSGGPDAITLIGTGLTVLNALLAITNLLPAAPLDGGRVLTALLWARTGRPEWARLISARCGLVLSAAATTFGLVELLIWERASGLYTLAIAMFLGTAARSDVVTAAIRGRLAAVNVGEVLTTHPTAVADGVTLTQLARLRPLGSAQVSLPVQRWQHQTIGYFSTAQIEQIPPEQRSWTTVSQIMTVPEMVPSAWTTEPLLTALERHGTESPQILGIDPTSGRVVGTATPDQFRALMARPTFWGNDRAQRLPVPPPPPPTLRPKAILAGTIPASPGLKPS